MDSQREESYEKLVKRMEEMKFNLSLYSWEFDLKKYGTVPHFGLVLRYKSDDLLSNYLKILFL